MHMKYFQGLADIENHYGDILRGYDGGPYGKSLLETWGIQEEDREDIVEEREVLRYLVACQTMLAREKSTYKPEQDVVNRLFNRQLYYLDTIHNCHAYNVGKHPSKLIQREYKTSTHYLFKFSLPAWYESLPDKIQTFDEKYGENWDR